MVRRCGERREWFGANCEGLSWGCGVVGWWVGIGEFGDDFCQIFSHFQKPTPQNPSHHPHFFLPLDPLTTSPTTTKSITLSKVYTVQHTFTTHLRTATNTICTTSNTLSSHSTSLDFIFKVNCQINNHIPFNPTFPSPQIPNPTALTYIPTMQQLPHWVMSNTTSMMGGHCRDWQNCLPTSPLH